MIYVVDVDHMRLAFAAGDESHAIRIVRSPCFMQAIGRSGPDRQGTTTTSHHPRAATVQERVVFHDVAAEFADDVADILVARVG